MTAKRAYAYWRDPQTTVETWGEYENVKDKWCPPARFIGRHGDSWFASADVDVLREFLHPRRTRRLHPPDPHPVEVPAEVFEEHWLKRQRWVQRRVTIRERYGKLFDRLRVLLAYHDPINLEVPEEWPLEWAAYDTQAEALIETIAAAEREEDMRQALHQEFLRSFIREVAGPDERYVSLARNVWALRQSGGDASV